MSPDGLSAVLAGPLVAGHRRFSSYPGGAFGGVRRPRGWIGDSPHSTQTYWSSTVRTTGALHAIHFTAAHRASRG